MRSLIFAALSCALLPACSDKYPASSACAKLASVGAVSNCAATDPPAAATYAIDAAKFYSPDGGLVLVFKDDADYTRAATFYGTPAAVMAGAQLLTFPSKKTLVVFGPKAASADVSKARDAL